jgi:hypothetical protein
MARRIAERVVVDAAGCHVWRGPLSDRGRPVLWVGRRRRKVHRLVWALANGPVPAGHDVHHRCRNRLCVRLEHLRLIGHRAHAVLHARTAAPGEREALARLAAHARWHAARRLLVPGCEHCDRRRLALVSADVAAPHARARGRA